MLIAIIPYFTLLILKQVNCSGNCNNIDNPYAKICAPDVIKDLTLKYLV